MTTFLGPTDKAHRLLAPRIAYLIGSQSTDGESNVIPVSNVTSASTSPEQVLLSILKEWQTYENLLHGDGFTLSVPRDEQKLGVWKLGARYSRYDYPSRTRKLEACGLRFVHDVFGPALADGYGWMACRIIERLDFGGDHGVFLGAVESVHFSAATFAGDGTPFSVLQPTMQITGNQFTTTADAVTDLPYGRAE